jgi:hypothetical protein
VAKNVAKRKTKSLDEVIARTLRDAGFSAKQIGEQIKRLDDPDAVRAILIGAGKDKRLDVGESKPVAPSGREGKGQGKVKKKGGMRKATAKGDATRIGQVAVKRAWSAARNAAGEDRWRVMTKEQKTAETLKRLGSMTGEEAIGAVRALGTRVLPLAGSNDEVNKIIDGWAKGQGVRAPKTEMKIAAKGKAEGKGGKEIARAGGKGAEAPAGPEKPALGKKARRIVRKRTRLDEILRTGEDVDSRTRRLAQKPTPDPDVVPGESEEARKARLKAARAEDRAFKEANMVEFENEDGTKRWIPKAEPLPEGTRKLRLKAKGGKSVVANVKKGNVYLLNENGKLRTMKLKDYKAALERGEDPNPPAKKKRVPSVKQEFGKKMETVSATGKALNAEYITESAAQAFIDANRKISEKNKIAIGKGTPTDKLAPRYTVQDFVDAAYPNLGQAERSSLIRGIRKSFRSERKARKAARADKAGTVTVLRPETVEEGRKKLSAKDVRIAKGKAAPLEKVKLESKAEGRRRGRRVKTVGQTLSAVMDPSKPTPSAESMEGAPKRAKRIITPKAPGSELEAEISKLRESLSPTEKSTFRKIKETARVGFTKPQIQSMAKAGTFGKVTPKVKKIAKTAGYLSIVAMALNAIGQGKAEKK